MHGEDGSGLLRAETCRGRACGASEFRGRSFAAILALWWVAGFHVEGAAGWSAYVDDVPPWATGRVGPFAASGCRCRACGASEYRGRRFRWDAGAVVDCSVPPGAWAGWPVLQDNARCVDAVTSSAMVPGCVHLLVSADRARGRAAHLDDELDVHVASRVDDSAFLLPRTGRRRVGGVAGWWDRGVSPMAAGVPEPMA